MALTWLLFLMPLLARTAQTSDENLPCKADKSTVEEGDIVCLVFNLENKTTNNQDLVINGPGGEKLVVYSFSRGSRTFRKKTNIECIVELDMAFVFVRNVSQNDSGAYVGFVTGGTQESKNVIHSCQICVETAQHNCSRSMATIVSDEITLLLCLISVSFMINIRSN